MAFLRAISGFFAVFVLALTMHCVPSFAAMPKVNASAPKTLPKVEGRYGSIVVDADSLDIVHARQIDEQRYPASLTKLMTLYLTFDALDDGRLTLNQKLPVSRKAQNTPPGKLGVKRGQFITVDQAIQALAVKSANDVSVVLAEAIGGSEANFAEMMTARAHSLGMMKTQFSNPHGLPNPLQVTTARDMAKLATAHLNNHRRYYHYFGQKKFRYKGKTYNNTNGLLHGVDGVDGFKTGYTRASGYNLVISAERDQRRLIAVVLGGASKGSRNTHMEDLIERSFETMGVRANVKLPPVQVASAPVKKTTRKVVREPLPKAAKTNHVSSTAVRLRGRGAAPVTIVTKGEPLKVQSATLDNAWSIQLGAFGSEAAAQSQLNGVKVMVGPQVRSVVQPASQQGRTLYRARFTDLSFEDAHKHCRALSALKTGCVVISPGGR